MPSLSKSEIIILGIVCVGVGGGAILSHINHAFFTRYYVVEDGPTEWGTFLVLIATMVICARRLVALWNKRPAGFLLITAFAALLFLFGAGEEISWGQRLFSFSSADFFQQYNTQGETNLHNLVMGGTKINKVVFSKGAAILFVLYLAVLTPLYRRKPAFAWRIDSLAIPVPRNYQIVAYVIALLVVEGLTDSPKRGELTEFGMPLILMLTVLYPSNRRIFDPDYRLPEASPAISGPNASEGPKWVDN